MFGFKKKENYKEKYLKMQMLYEDLLEEEKQKEKPIEPEVDVNSIEYVDSLSGLEFEEYVKQLLIKLGYTNVVKTKASGDFGIDVLAQKDYVTYAVQCKLYQSPLGNDSIQEAYAGKEYYDKDLAIVITNSTFTEGAKMLAKKTGVVLWDREILKQMIGGESSVTFKRNITSNDDPLYEEVLEFVKTQNNISTSIIQRKFKIGYNRAARLIDTLEEQGIIGPQNGSNPREVIIH